MTPQTFVVGFRDADQTVAAFLRARLNLPWSKAKRLVESGHVRVAGQKVIDPAHRLKIGKHVDVATEILPTRPKTVRARFKDAPPYDGPMPVLVYSDDSIAVVDKPAGLTTMRHAEEAAEFGERAKKFLPTTLADLLPTMLGRPGKAVHAVHRIDRDTSGLVVFARTKPAEDQLTEQFKLHTVERRYLALVRGEPKSGTIESTLVDDRGDGRRGSRADGDGQRAVTHMKVVEQLSAFALVECRLETGRTHQVRIHLGEAGWPLCGERVYDRPLHGRPIVDGSDAKRPMLHAARLGLTHPATGERMVWESATPADFRELLARLRQGGPKA
ncbi:MAG TPA: RluA family pseudouridine synthase [Gemmataceae bacterium]|jgi:23S rRNA pseudouridine1911/1915/1917 synthase|nr:RluA family pseudouridine synthase [Gemmataceae bacterium]